jgi:hypothetical protein
VLRARGVPAAVRIGVRRDGDEVLAHAWIEAGGCVLDEAQLAGEYAVLENRGPMDVAGAASAVGAG